MSKIIVIGAGFSGLAAATCLADAGEEVLIVEKNSMAGGRARKFEAAGFTFDMGPSWYWMPDVFEDYFALFGKKVVNYYQLERLNPSYRIFFEQQRIMDVPAEMKELEAMFETYEKGSSLKLRQFLAEAAYKYKVGMKEFVHKPSHSLLEYIDWRLFKSLFGLHFLSSMSTYIKKYFSNEHLIQLLEFPVLFLGATPQNTPAMYSMMNYADLALGTWYPMGGMHKIVEGMVALAREKGVQFSFDTTVERIEINKGEAKEIITNRGNYKADIVIGSADYHHIEQHLLAPEYRQYTPKYWDKRVMAPSSLLFFLGVNKRLNNLRHHNLFFDEDFQGHAEEIYTHPKWPKAPLFYACVPSVTDNSVAPDACENLFLLVPIAPDLEDSPQIRDHYYQLIMKRLESLTGQSVADHVIYKRSFAHSDFKQDYNAFKGNAYGLANTIMQTAFLKPKMKSPKVSNLYYTGQLTVPGPGVPPSLISGQVVAQEVLKALKKNGKRRKTTATLT